MQEYLSYIIHNIATVDLSLVVTAIRMFRQDFVSYRFILEPGYGVNGYNQQLDIYILNITNPIGENLPNRSDSMPLSYWALINSRKDIAKELFLSGANVEAKAEGFDHTPLCYAIASKDLELAEIIIMRRSLSTADYSHTFNQNSCGSHMAHSMASFDLPLFADFMCIRRKYRDKSKLCWHDLNVLELSEICLNNNKLNLFYYLLSNYDSSKDLHSLMNFFAVKNIEKGIDHIVSENPREIHLSLYDFTYDFKPEALLNIFKSIFKHKLEHDLMVSIDPGLMFFCYIRMLTSSYGMQFNLEDIELKQYIILYFDTYNVKDNDLFLKKIISHFIKKSKDFRVPYSHLILALEQAQNLDFLKGLLDETDCEGLTIIAAHCIFRHWEDDYSFIEIYLNLNVDFSMQNFSAFAGMCNLEVNKKVFEGVNLSSLQIIEILVNLITGGMQEAGMFFLESMSHLGYGLDSIFPEGSVERNFFNNQISDPGNIDFIVHKKLDNLIVFLLRIGAINDERLAEIRAADTIEDIVEDIIVTPELPRKRKLVHYLLGAIREKNLAEVISLRFSLQNTFMVKEDERNDSLLNKCLQNAFHDYHQSCTLFKPLGDEISFKILCEVSRLPCSLPKEYLETCAGKTVRDRVKENWDVAFELQRISLFKGKLINHTVQSILEFAGIHPIIFSNPDTRKSDPKIEMRSVKRKRMFSLKNG